MTEVVLSLGSNLGDRLGNLKSAIEQLSSRHIMSDINTSSVYETAPIGGPEQEDFLNIVCIGKTTHEPVSFLQEIQSIENDLGRTRTVRWGPREIDIDIITFGDVLLNSPTLDIPHARAFQRAFVLMPWLELDEEALLPGFGPASQFLTKIGNQDIIRQDAYSHVLKSSMK